MEGTELDGDTGPDAKQGGEGAFVEGEGTFMRPDVAGAGEGGGVSGGCLEANFDDICDRGSLRGP